MRTAAELREGFLSFFEAKDHVRQPSGSLVPPPEDTSTLLTTAGMQPLRPYFLGEKQPPSPRLTTVQKCFRTPDIDEVGLTLRHLTCFEMLGNFSIGDYFKDGAVDLAWEFVTEHMRLDTSRLWATVYEGNAALGLDEDEVAIRAWERVGIPPERIVRLGKDNFWQAAATGPCGPSSEIFYDKGPEFGPEGRPGDETDRYLEIWNLVFMEFDLHEDGTLTPLPTQNIDTGMGIERASTVLQQVPSVFDIDSYQEIMAFVAERSGTRYGESETATKAHRVLADHGRGMTFLVGDGVVPSNEGRGYVLRRIIRRAVQHAGRIGLESPFLGDLAEVVADQMHPWYPELEEHRGRIREVLTAEEERFTETLARGMRLFDEVATGNGISGEDAFKLHDTYGFPLELTRELARERGLAVDEEEFGRLMEEQRERSRTAAAFEVRVTGPRTEFVGYEATEVLTAIVAYEEREGGEFEAKLERSPFYPEGGGQVSDAGYIEHEETGARARLVRAARVGDDQVLVFEGPDSKHTAFALGDRVKAVVPWDVRFPTMANHTGTHLLHAALREVLGDHVRQAGSAVRPDKLRFDFTHGQPLTPDEREAVERRVNQKVFENLPVRAFVTPIDEARKLGAMMLFGEKYGEDVRVVEIPGFSRELCGGTHVRSTAEVGPFVIVTESSVGAGTRRIEALTAGEAYTWLLGRVHEAAELRGELERARKEGRRPQREAAAEIVAERRVEAGDVAVIVVELSGSGPDDMLQLSDRLKQQNAPAAVVLGSREDGRVHLVANFDASLEGRLDAVAVIKGAAALVGGGGGGRATMARAGGKDPEKLPDALAEAERLIVAALNG
jgi:alanyl-tRNA synthetase